MKEIIHKIFRHKAALKPSKLLFPHCVKSFIKLAAFTLAEVLIVLGIIGIIAEMTIPTLMNNVQDATFNSSLKKEYSSFAGALLMIVKNNGTVNVGSSSVTDVDMRNDFCSVMRCLKQDTVWNVFSPNVYKFYNGGSANWPQSGDSSAAAILSDGTLIEFATYSSCTSGDIGNACGYIYIDVNGKKPPNMQGKDFLSFWVTNKSGNYLIVPMGAKGERSCASPATSWPNGDGCTALRYMNPSALP